MRDEESVEILALKQGERFLGFANITEFSTLYKTQINLLHIEDLLNTLFSLFFFSSLLIGTVA